MTPDETLRSLEREAQTTGDPTIADRLAQARKRVTKRKSKPRPERSKARLYRAIADALENDEHIARCDDSACDINAAYRQGLYLWAAHMLDSSGACDDPDDPVSVAYRRYQARVRAWRKHESAECAELCDSPHQDCPRCNAIVWNDEDERCGNCLAALPRYTWRVAFHAHSGCSPESWQSHDDGCNGKAVHGQDADHIRDARAEVARQLRALRKAGHRVVTLDRERGKSRARDAGRWESTEPAQCVMVPDTCGILILERVNLND
jgi:hypothetical protein